MTDHEALEPLSKKATQGELWLYGEPDVGLNYEPFFGAPLEGNMRPLQPMTREDEAFVIALWNAYRTGQLIPAPSVDDAMVERCAIFRQIGRWEMAYEIAFNLETPVKDCTPGAPEQAAFDKAAKLVSMSVSALAGREFCKLPVHVQFHDGEWAPIMDEATAAISAMQVKP